MSNNPAPKAKPQTMKVRAIKTGYYDLQRRREGAEFEISSASEFSPIWMVPVDKTPEAWRETIERTTHRAKQMDPRFILNYKPEPAARPAS